MAPPLTTSKVEMKFQQDIQHFHELRITQVTLMGVVSGNMALPNTLLLKTKGYQSSMDGEGTVGGTPSGKNYL